MANDTMLDLTIAFLNSSLEHSSLLPLCLIPFDESCDRIIHLQEQYGFLIYQNTRVLKLCDDISRRFHRECMGHYRKLAMWDGLFSHFIYSDVDTVLLAKVDFIFDLLRDYDFVTADSGYVPSVWNNSIQTSGLLSVEQIEYSANTGMVASTLHSLSIANICERVEDALRLAPYMCLMCQEQPLLNYLIVTSAKRYTSLDIIARKGRYPSVMCDYWAGFASAKSRQPKHPDHFPVCRVHWAGVDKPYRDCQGNLVVPPEMPLSSLWKHYRFLPQI